MEPRTVVTVLLLGVGFFLPGSATAQVNCVGNYYFEYQNAAGSPGCGNFYLEYHEDSSEQESCGNCVTKAYTGCNPPPTYNLKWYEPMVNGCVSIHYANVCGGSCPNLDQLKSSPACSLYYHLDLDSSCLADEVARAGKSYMLPCGSPPTCTFGGVAVEDMLGEGPVDPAVSPPYIHNSCCPSCAYSWPCTVCSSDQPTLDSYQAAWRDECHDAMETQDADGDGSVYPWDCDETDPDRGPGVPENCTNSVDDDCDGLIDNADNTDPEVCGDGIDNDCDGDTDYDDAGPFGAEVCGNGLDDDCDGDVDEEGSPSDEVCGDGKDNDCDGKVDEGCCDESDPDCCEKQRGRPVNMVTGTAYTDPVTDVRVATPGVPLEFARRYDSALGDFGAAANPDRLVLGPGWSHTYDIRVRAVRDADTQAPTAVVVSGGGFKDLWLENGGAGTIYTKKGRREVVEKVSGGWVLHYPDGRRAGFSGAGSDPKTSGVLAYIADRSKQGVRISRDAAGRIDTVTSYKDAVTPGTETGAHLQLSYNGSAPYKGMLASVVLHSGATTRTWTYDYTQTSLGRPILVKVTHPAPTHRATTYSYTVTTGPPVRYALARVVNENETANALQELHQYGTDGRVVRTVSPEGEFAFSYDTTNHKTYAYSLPLGGKLCGPQHGLCDSGACEGTCADAPEKLCTQDSHCTGGGGCDLSSGRCYVYCVTDVSCGANYYCALDPALSQISSAAAGRCYGRRELVEYGASGGAEGNVTHADSCSGCTFGDIYNTWNSDGTLFSVKRVTATSDRWDTFEFDSSGRTTKSTTNNSAETTRCKKASAAEPCLVMESTYPYSDAPRWALPGVVTENSVFGNWGTRKTTHTYNAAGQVLTIQRQGKTRTVDGSTVARTYTTTYAYDAGGRLQTIDPPDPAGQAGNDNSTGFTYHLYDGTAKSGKLATVSRKAPGSTKQGGGDSVLVTTYSSYNEHGQPTAMTLPDGSSVALSYDPEGHLIERNHAAQVTAFDYDTLGRLKRVVFSGNGGCNHYSYRPGTDQLERIVVTDTCPTDATAGDGDSALLTYHENGKLESVSYFAQSSSTATYYLKRDYDPHTGRIARRYDRGTNQTDRKRFSHDAFGRLEKLGDEVCTDATFASSDCPVRTWTYNGLDRVLSVSRQLSATDTVDTSYELDSAARTSKVTSGPSATEVVTTYVHDDFGRLVEVSSPDSGLTRFEYDDAGNVAKKRTGAGTVDEATVDYTYDGQSRVLTMTSGTDHCSSQGLGQDIHYHYDWHADCQTHGMCINGTGRLVMVEVETGCTEATPSIPTFRRNWFNYTQQGNVNAERYQWPGGGAADAVIEYTYTPWGGLASVTLPSGSVIQYGYPEGDRRVKDVTFNEAPIASNIDYLPFGPVQSFNLGNPPPEGLCNNNPVAVALDWDTGQFLYQISTSDP